MSSKTRSICRSDVVLWLLMWTEGPNDDQKSQANNEERPGAAFVWSNPTQKPEPQRAQSNLQQLWLCAFFAHSVLVVACLVACSVLTGSRLMQCPCDERRLPGCWRDHLFANPRHDAHSNSHSLCLPEHKAVTHTYIHSSPTQITGKRPTTRCLANKLSTLSPQPLVCHIPRLY